MKRKLLYFWVFVLCLGLCGHRAQMPVDYVFSPLSEQGSDVVLQTAEF